MKKFLVMAAASAVIAGGAMVAAIAPASAAVVCNRSGDCWHTTERYKYRPSFGITVHPDTWKWSGTKYHWNEHSGRGYWRNGLWVTF
jgi:hypothetical protein